MTQLERVIEQFREYLEGKKVLELACGTALFSLAAAKYAESVVCLDLDGSRLDKRVSERDNIVFVTADAAHTGLESANFDWVVLYNALYHIKDQWPEILAEGKRLLKPAGSFFLISSWKLDKALMAEMYSGVEQRDGYSICSV